jgi:hypothetical protein
MTARRSIRSFTLNYGFGALIAVPLIVAACVTHFAEPGSLALAASDALLRIGALAAIGVAVPHIYGLRRYWFEEPIYDHAGRVKHERRPSPLGLRLSLCAAFASFAALSAAIVLNCFPSLGIPGLGHWFFVAAITLIVCNLAGLYCSVWLVDRRAGRSYKRGER